jgi:hypothetical protein
MTRSLRLVLLAALVACDRSSEGSAAPPGSASAATDSRSGAPLALTPVAASSAAASRIAPARPSAAAQSWHGAYRSAAATLTVPPDWKKVHWSDTQSTAGIGDGTMALTLDGATGQLSGMVDGPLGPATVEGVVADGTVAATLRRKDPADEGFTGTLLGSIAGDHVEGTMSMSLGLASALRTATFRLSPGTPPGAAP